MPKTTRREPLHWQDDGAGPNRPVPDWWEASEIREVAGRLVYFSFGSDSRARRELIDTPARLVELSAQFGADDAALALALRILDGSAPAAAQPDDDDDDDDDDAVNLEIWSWPPLTVTRC